MASVSEDMKGQQSMAKLKPEPEPKARNPEPQDEIRQFVSDQNKLAQARRAATKLVEQKTQELDKCRAALAEAQSQRLIEEGDDFEEAAEESDEFVQASLAVEQARAAAGGVLKRVRAADVEVLTHAERLRHIRDNHNRTEVQRFLTEEFSTASEAFAAVLRRGLALEDALGCEIPALHHLPEHGEWDSDEAAKALYAEQSPLRELAESLETFRREAESRLIVQERNKRSRAGFDPSARYEVRASFQCYGREFAPGQTVDRHSIDLKLLAQLYASRRLTLIEPKEEWTQ